VHKKCLSAWSAPVILVTAAAATVFLSGAVASAATSPKAVDAIPVQIADAAMTTTTLEVTPTLPTDANITEILTAKLTPATAAGTVQFNDGGSTLGERVAIANGTASTTVTLPSGDHSLTAVFIPSDTTAFSGSTSNIVDYTANGQDGQDGQKGKNGQDGQDGSIDNGNNINNDNDSHHKDGNCGDEGNKYGNRHSNQRNSGINQDIADLVNSGGLLADLASNLRAEDSHHVTKAQRHAMTVTSKRRYS
jgi:hypothetical protein